MGYVPNMIMIFSDQSLCHMYLYLLNRVRIEFVSSSNRVRIEFESSSNRVRIDFESSSNRVRIEFESNSNRIVELYLYIIFMLRSEEEFEESFFSYFHRH